MSLEEELKKLSDTIHTYLVPEVLYEPRSIIRHGMIETIPTETDNINDYVLKGVDLLSYSHDLDMTIICEMVNEDDIKEDDLVLSHLKLIIDNTIIWWIIDDVMESMVEIPIPDDSDETRIRFINFLHEHADEFKMFQVLMREYDLLHTKKLNEASKKLNMIYELFGSDDYSYLDWWSHFETELYSHIALIGKEFVNRIMQQF